MYMTYSIVMITNALIILLLYRPASQCACGLEPWISTLKCSVPWSLRESGMHTPLDAAVVVILYCCRLKTARAELAKMMAELKEKEEALEVVETKVSYYNVFCFTIA